MCGSLPNKAFNTTWAFSNCKLSCYTPNNLRDRERSQLVSMYDLTWLNMETNSSYLPDCANLTIASFRVVALSGDYTWLSNKKGTSLFWAASNAKRTPLFLADS